MLVDVSINLFQFSLLSESQGVDLVLVLLQNPIDRERLIFNLIDPLLVLQKRLVSVNKLFNLFLNPLEPEIEILVQRFHWSLAGLLQVLLDVLQLVLDVEH